MRIKQHRKNLGLRADDLAEIIGCSRSTIFRYENGDIKKIPSNLIKPLADALQITPEYIIGKEKAVISSLGCVSIKNNERRIVWTSQK